MDRAKSALEDFELGLFNKVGHANFCARCLAGLPATMAEADSSRMAIGFYCLGALDILGLLETKVKEADREAWRAWIWAQQVRRPPGPGHGSNVKKSASKTGSGIGKGAVPGCNPDGNQDDEDQRWIGGFRPGPFMHVELGKDEAAPETRSTGTSMDSTSTHGEADPPHLIMTYTALLALAIIRDDFGHLDREGLVNLLRATQKPDGSFTSFPGQGESDIRMVYTAFAISAMLNDWSGIDVPLAVDFAKRCMSYEGGFGQVPENEAQGGSTYCALATLALAPEQHRTEAMLSALERKRTERWLVQQQKPRGGFSGRTEKVEDACYSFWCGAALRILRSGLVGGEGGLSSQLQLHSRSHLDTKSSASSNVVKRHLQREETEYDDDEGDFVDRLTHARFLSRCQFRLGGLAKAPGAHPDPYHTYLALAALALYPPPQLPPPRQNPNPNQPATTFSTINSSGTSEVHKEEKDNDGIEPSDTELLGEMKVERRRKERESWKIAQLDPLINATVETSRWARERIPSPGKQR
ncbi:CDC43 [Sanghuangporus weigelae]